MSKMIQIRNVPDDIHAALKARAARNRITMSDMLLNEIAQVAKKPTMAEWLEMVEQGEPVDLGDEPERWVREGRDSR